MTTHETLPCFCLRFLHFTPQPTLPLYSSFSIPVTKAAHFQPKKPILVSLCNSQLSCCQCAGKSRCLTTSVSSCWDSCHYWAATSGCTVLVRTPSCTASGAQQQKNQKEAGDQPQQESQQRCRRHLLRPRARRGRPRGRPRKYGTLSRSTRTSSSQQENNTTGAVCSWTPTTPDENPTLLQRRWADDYIDVVLNIIEFKISQFKKSNITD